VRTTRAAAAIIFRADSQYVLYTPGVLTTREALAGPVTDTTPAREIETGAWVLRDRADGTPLLCVRPDRVRGQWIDGFGREQCATYLASGVSFPRLISWLAEPATIAFTPYRTLLSSEVHLPLLDSAPHIIESDAYFEFQVERQAAALPGPSPRYPAMLHSANIEGTVLAQFVVDTTGRVVPSTFKVVASSHELFTQAVRNILAELRYTPAEVGGRKVAQVVQRPFHFTMHQ
jgi:TonB family protein